MAEVQLHHVSLIVSDTRNALDFYNGLLGLAVIERPALGFPGAWLGIGEQQLHLLELANPDPVSGRPEHGGRDRHIALLVDAIDAYEERLKARDIPFTRSRSGRAALFCRDPDGNGVELVQRPGEGSPASQEQAESETPRKGFFMDEIVNAFFFSEWAPYGEPTAFVCLEENRIVYCSSEYGGCVDDNEEEMDCDGCIPLPHKNELDLGKRLVFSFMQEFMAEDLNKVERMFSRRGAYRRFKAYLEERDILERWYDYENSAQEAALRAWCEWNEIPLKD